MRFPTKFTKGMPWVNFVPYTYLMPAVNSQPAPVTKSGADGISAVDLFLPGDFNERIQADWSEQDVIGGATEGLDMIQTEGWDFLKKTAGAKTSATVAAATGAVSYPTDILIFNHVAPVQLSFNFNMVPFDEEEGDNIIAICKNFKKAILPKLNMADSIARLHFPAIWDISFRGIRGLGVENENIYKQMALINVGVDYGSGATSVLTFYDGNPVQVRLSLTFQSIRKQRLL